MLTAWIKEILQVIFKHNIKFNNEEKETVPIHNLTTIVILKKGFPGGSDGKESFCNVGDLGLIPGLGISPGEQKGYSGLENSMDCIVHGVTKSWT